MSNGTGFIAALLRNVEIQDPELQAMGMAVRRGTRERKPRKFFDEDGKVDTNIRTPEKGHQPRQPEPAGKQRGVGVNRRYGTINVRTLAMKDDKNSKEADGRVAAALKWACEFEARGLGVIGLQECRVPGQVDGQEGECYRTFYSDNRDGESKHGVGLYLHTKVTRGEFDIQQVSERVMWVYGSIYGVQQAAFSVYAPTNRSDNEHEVMEFYSLLEREVRAVRKKYGADVPIVILGDFNARVENGGAEDRYEECAEEGGQECPLGIFEFDVVNDNGAELTTFCVREKLKIMDSYFDRLDGDFGTWRCNRSNDKGYGAALDHILVGKSLWAAVEHCGVHIPIVRWNTDHRMVELDLGKATGEERQGTDDENGPEKEPQSAETREHIQRKAFNKYVLWCKLELDPDGVLRRISGTLDQMISKAKSEMLQNRGEGPDWERDTISNAESLLKMLNDAVTETIAELFPDGVPASKQRKGRRWNSNNSAMNALYKERDTVIKALENGKANGTQIRDVQYLTAKIE
jgi:exonuclease III